MDESETIAFAPAVLRILHVLVPPGTTEADLALELGLSAAMQASDTELDEALHHLWVIRQAILESSAMDTADEPVPLSGRVARLDLLNLAIYLANLVERAAGHLRCERTVVVETVIERLAVHQVPTGRSRIRALRSS